MIGGAVERDLIAKELKFYINVTELNHDGNGIKDSEGISKDQINSIKDLDIDTCYLQRVFIHQSSLNFQNNTFRESNIIVVMLFLL